MKKGSGLKILHITGALSGGGAERQLHLLLKHYAAAEHSVFALNAKAGEQYNDVTVPIYRRTSRTGWRELTRLMNQLKPDIVHCWIPATLPYALPAIYAYGRKKVVVVAGIRSAYKFDHWQRRMQHALFQVVDSIVSNVHPDIMLPAYRKVYVRKQGRFIPNGLDFTHLLSSLPIAPAAIAQNVKIPFILYAGRLIPDKNLGQLLKALVKIPDNQLVICGKGEEEDQLRTFCKKADLGDRVFFSGYRKDIYSIMKTAQVFVLPSLREGMPNVAFEALAAGCQLVLSDIPVHRYWFEKFSGARLFAGNDIDALAATLQKAITDERALADASELLDQVTPKTFAANYHNYYQEVTALHSL